jgi:ComF family protein
MINPKSLIIPFSSLLDLFFPRLCLACNERLVEGELFLCLHCLNDIPYAKFDDLKDNKLIQQFWGRCQIENATAYFHFLKESRYQNIIHQIKYNEQKQLAVYLGKQLGLLLLKTELAEIDYIIPVPLHKKRLKERGYNQSELIASGLAETMKKEILTQNITRIKYSKTQTKKSRYHRWENVKDLFELTANTSILKNKHILLVDDVITTGATIEACVNCLTKIENIKISVAGLAFASLSD